MAGEYKILDEPEPSTLAQYAVDPYWPLLATMLGGSWIGLPWYAFNAHAIGSATKRSELTWAIASPLVSVAVAFVAFTAVELLGLPSRSYAYVFAGLIAIKLYFAYRIHFHQAKSHAIHEHYQGSSKSGLAVVLGAAFSRALLLGWAAKVSDYLFVVVL